jgi:hypothetical protein
MLRIMMETVISCFGHSHGKSEHINVSKVILEMLEQFNIK